MPSPGDFTLLRERIKVNRKRGKPHKIPGKRSNILVVIQDENICNKAGFMGVGLGKKRTLLCNVKDMLTYLLLYILEICK